VGPARARFARYLTPSLVLLHSLSSWSAQKLRPNAVLIEDAAKRRAVLQTLRTQACVPACSLHPELAFQADCAAHGCRAACWSGQLGFHHRAAPLLEELPRFPRGSKDLVDAFGQGFGPQLARIPLLPRSWHQGAEPLAGCLLTVERCAFALCLPVSGIRAGFTPPPGPDHSARARHRRPTRLCFLLGFNELALSLTPAPATQSGPPAASAHARASRQPTPCARSTSSWPTEIAATFPPAPRSYLLLIRSASARGDRPASRPPPLHGTGGRLFAPNARTPTQTARH